MTDTMPIARAAITLDADWRVSLDRALNEFAGVQPSALLLFASHHHAEGFPELVAEVARRTAAPIVIGCSAIGVIGMDREVERTSGVSLLALSLPQHALSAARITQGMLDAAPDGDGLAQRIGIPKSDVGGWLVFADPYRIDGDAMITALSGAYPGTTILGGFASPGPSDRRTWVFLNGECYTEGGVALGIGGGFEIVPVVSQGCDPIGEPWTVTSVQSHWIETISNRPALQILVETLNALPDDIRERAKRNLLIGVAADEYRHEFLRGDFLVRNLVGIDQASGAIAIGAVPRVGQTVQFQMRDAATADLDLNLLLEQAKLTLNGRRPVAGILCTCNGRGDGLFGTPHHDAQAIGRKLGGIPLAGLFCAGEIGPIGPRTFVHGFTACLGLIVPKP